MSNDPQYEPLPAHNADEESQPLVEPAAQGSDDNVTRARRFKLGIRRRVFQITAVVLLATFLFFGVYLYLYLDAKSRPPPKYDDPAWDTPCSSGHLPEHYVLPSGDKIPSLALGVWLASKLKVGTAVKAALKAGYRHIDGAWIYGNEAEVGQAVKESGVAREEIWLTSKLWNSFHAPEDIEPILDDTLAKLGTSYIDLYLIHWPVAFEKNSQKVNKALTDDPYPTWKKLEELVVKGKIRNIGLSNFNIRRIQNLTANPLKIQPAINQVELSYWNPQPDLLKWSKEHNMLLEAYSPLGGSSHVRETLSLPEVMDIAQQLGMTPAQVNIAWLIQRGSVALPKTTTPSRVRENCHLRALPDALFERLELAAQSHKPMRVSNPSGAWKLGYDIFDD